MKVYGIDIPDDKGLTNFDFREYARELGIEHGCMYEMYVCDVCM